MGCLFVIQGFQMARHVSIDEAKTSGSKCYRRLAACYAEALRKRMSPRSAGISISGARRHIAVATEPCICGKVYAARNTVDFARPVDLADSTFAELLSLLGARRRAR